MLHTTQAKSAIVAATIVGLSTFGAKPVQAFQVFTDRQQWNNAVSSVSTWDFNDSTIQNARRLGDANIGTQFVCPPEGFPSSNVGQSVSSGRYFASINQLNPSFACQGIFTEFNPPQLNPIGDVFGFGFDLRTLINTGNISGEFDANNAGNEVVSLNTLYQGNSTFIGIVSNQPITGFNITGLGNVNTLIELDNFSVATGLSNTTEIPTPALLPGLLGMSAAAIRKRRKASVRT